MVVNHWRVTQWKQQKTWSNKTTAGSLSAGNFPLNQQKQLKWFIWTNRFKQTMPWKPKQIYSTLPTEPPKKVCDLAPSQYIKILFINHALIYYTIRGFPWGTTLHLFSLSRKPCEKVSVFLFFVYFHWHFTTLILYCYCNNKYCNLHKLYIARVQHIYWNLIVLVWTNVI